MTMKFEDEYIKLYAASADDDHFGDDEDNDDLHNRFEDEEEEVTMTSDDDDDELELDDDGTIRETHAEEATIFALMLHVEATSYEPPTKPSALPVKSAASAFTSKAEGSGKEGSASRRRHP